MNLKNLKYLVISRYLTYMLSYIGYIVILKDSLKDIGLFTLLFLIIIVSSSMRITKFIYKKTYFIISIIIEIIIITYMNYRFCTLSFIFLFIIIVDIFLMLEFKEALIILIFVFLSFLISIWISDLAINRRYSLPELLSLTAGITFFSAASYGIRKLFYMNEKMKCMNAEIIKSKKEIEIKNEKLKEYSEKVQQVTVLNERNRLAGEIHDTIGHSLTGLIMEINICKKLIQKNDINRIKDELEKAEEIAKYSLIEVRKSVRTIKSSKALIGIDSIKKLVEDYKRSSNVNVELEISKFRYKLSPAAEVTIYRAVQESLTNCSRYAHARNMFISILFKEKMISIIIKNDGVCCKSIKKGVGLTTMQERVEVLGGKINFSGENGFEISISIPTEENYE